MSSAAHRFGDGRLIGHTFITIFHTGEDISGVYFSDRFGDGRLIGHTFITIFHTGEDISGVYFSAYL